MKAKQVRKFKTLQSLFTKEAKTIRGILRLSWLQMSDRMQSPSRDDANEKTSSPMKGGCNVRNKSY